MSTSPSGTVVVAFSPDDFGRAALDAGVREARRLGGPLVVVNVTRGASLVDRRYAHGDELDDLVARLDADLGPDGVEVQVVRDLVDDVAEAVVDAVRQHDAALAVVGVRPRTPVGKLVLGSVAQRVILEAPCDVLAVKPAG